MANAGRILIIPRGDYDNEFPYEMLDLVYHNGTSWLAKKTVVGIEPSEENEEYWHLVVKKDETKVVTFNPTNATNHDNYNGCYYTKTGNTVHLHLGLKDLTPNDVRKEVFVLPEEVRPQKLVSALGISDSELDTFALGYIEPSGTVQVRSNTAYACLEFNYNI